LKLYETWAAVALKEAREAIRARAGRRTEVVRRISCSF
jgi:hypothetical protein